MQNYARLLERVTGEKAVVVLSDDAVKLPPKLEEYLLSVQPGYEDDPGQAVYNRAWILGDDTAVSVDQQAQIDATRRDARRKAR